MICPNCKAETTMFKKILTFESDVYEIDGKIIVDNVQTPKESYHCKLCLYKLSDSKESLLSAVSSK